MAAPDIRDQVSDGVVDAIKRLSKDQDFMKQFWRGGWEELVTHSANASSQWVGKRIFTVFVGAVVTAGLVWLVKSGALK
jgi:hypothetical protein